MSLINDALKRAQGDRHGAVPPLPPQGSGPVPPPLHPGGKGRPLVQLVIILGVMVGLLTAVAGLLVLLVLKQRDTPATADAAPPAAAAVAEDAVTVEPPPADPVVAVQPAPAAEPAAPQAEAAPASIPESPPAVDSVVQAAAPPSVASAEAAAPPPARNQAIVDWVNAVEVRGVMTASGRVLLLLPGEDRAVRVGVGSNVNLEHGLTLQSIEPTMLIFVDERGTQYARRF